MALRRVDAEGDPPVGATWIPNGAKMTIMRRIACGIRPTIISLTPCA
jgi:hypothetical protein